ncbi:MAG: enoyl-CoA hydratase-related protein, partial [Variovorax sp.]
MTAERPQVKVERDGAACRLTIDRAESHNTMSDAVMLELVDALHAAESMEGVRAIVLTGAGDKTFCAGGQLKPTADGSPFALEPGRFDNPVAELFRALDKCNLPVIARVNGGAFGGGLGLVCACDFAVACDDAMFGTTEAKVGVFPMMILPLLMRVIPRRRL